VTWYLYYSTNFHYKINIMYLKYFEKNVMGAVMYILFNLLIGGILVCISVYGHYKLKKYLENK